MGLRCLKSAIAGLFTILILAGCQTTQTESVEKQNQVVAAPDSFTSAGQQKVTLRPGVVFSYLVEVGGITEVEVSDLRVREDGKAVLPMVGSVELNGMTLPEASDRLSELYSTFYTQTPLISMQFSGDAASDSSPWGYVTVLGRVKKPGRVNLPPTRDLKLSGAIQGADGFDTSANLKAVRISRTDSHNETRQMVVDMYAIGEGEAVKDIQLKAGDVVYVPETIF